MTEGAPRAVRLELPITRDDDLRTLRSALLAARASDRAELERRAARSNFGYGSDAARASMEDDVVRFRRRIELLDRLLAALGAAGAEDSSAS
jgi:hypothetical protein